MTNNLISITNNGVEIVETNYWKTEAAKAGFCYLSWNAGAARLLVPQLSTIQLEDMCTAKFVVITPKDLVLEILFDDESDFPYLIQLDVRQCDRKITKQSGPMKFPLFVYTEKGKQFELPGKINFL
jgi:hypothetical protein